MKAILLVAVFVVLVGVNEAVKGKFTPLPFWRKDVRWCARVAANALKGPSAYVKYLWWAGGQRYKKSSGRFYYYRVGFSVGPWKKKNCIAYCVWPKNFKSPYLTKRWPRPWGQSRCWPR